MTPSTSTCAARHREKDVRPRGVAARPDLWVAGGRRQAGTSPMRGARPPRRAACRLPALCGHERTRVREEFLEALAYGAGFETLSAKWQSAIREAERNRPPDCEALPDPALPQPASVELFFGEVSEEARRGFGISTATASSRCPSRFRQRNAGVRSTAAPALSGGPPARARRNRRRRSRRRSRSAGSCQRPVPLRIGDRGS